ncbi:MAG TPA: cation diffusion facilitator family transporter [Candidatus Saccharimonadales bacterium]|nr:cation diffusion facilitator family transporter [Candidatus Saccharimonadales bacterium]
MATERLQRGLRATFAGLIANVVLAGGKLAAGILGNSHALVADAVESFADVFSSIVVWRGLVIAAAPADQEHPYGHGKAEPIAAALVSTMLLFAAAAIAISSLKEIMTPKAGPRPYTLLVLVVVIVIKEGLFRFVRSEAKAVDSPAVQTDAWHHRSDVITSLAAAVGISISLIGGKGYESADDIAAIVAAGIIAWNGWGLLKPALAELMDTAPSQSFHDEVRRLAVATSGVELVEKCVVRKMGYHHYVDMHVQVDPQMSVLRAHEIAHQVKDKVRNSLPTVRDVLVHIEPSRDKQWDPK